MRAQGVQGWGYRYLGSWEALRGQREACESFEIQKGDERTGFMQGWVGVRRGLGAPLHTRFRWSDQNCLVTRRIFDLVAPGKSPALRAAAWHCPTPRFLLRSAS